MGRRDILVLAGTALASVAAGSAVTYFIVNKKLSREFDARLDKEVQESVDFFADHMIKAGKLIISNQDPDELADEMNEQELPFEAFVVEEDLEPVDGERVLKSQDDKPSIEELAARNQRTQYNKILTEQEYDTDAPDEEIVESSGWDPGDEDISVISRDIFMECVSQFEQSTLTYFSDDGVLDAQGDFVEDHFKMIGNGRPPFGQMSEDDNIVYVRNKKLEQEYEIISDPGKATEFLMHSLADLYKPSQRR